MFWHIILLDLIVKINLTRHWKFKYIETFSIAYIENSQYGNWLNCLVIYRFSHPSILPIKSTLNLFSSSTNYQSQHLSRSWDLLLQKKGKWCRKKNRVSMPQRGFFMYLANHQNLVTWKIHVHRGTKLYNVISSEQFSIWTVSHIHCFCVWSTTHTAYFENVLSFLVYTKSMK